MNDVIYFPYKLDGTTSIRRRRRDKSFFYPASGIVGENGGETMHITKLAEVYPYSPILSIIQVDAYTNTNTKTNTKTQNKHFSTSASIITTPIITTTKKPETTPPTTTKEFCASTVLNKLPKLTKDTFERYFYDVRGIDPNLFHIIPSTLKELRIGKNIEIYIPFDNLKGFQVLILDKVTYQKKMVRTKVEEYGTLKSFTLNNIPNSNNGENILYLEGIEDCFACLDVFHSPEALHSIYRHCCFDRLGIGKIICTFGKHNLPEPDCPYRGDFQKLILKDNDKKYNNDCKIPLNYITVPLEFKDINDFLLFERFC